MFRSVSCTQLLLLLPLVAGSCGRLGYDPRLNDGGSGGEDAPGPDDAAVLDGGAVVDGAVIDGATADAPGVDAAPCQLGPFGTPVLIENLGVQPDLFGPRPSADGLTLYFSRSPGAPHTGEDIWVTTRTERTAPFGAAALVVPVNSSAQDGSPFLAWDGLSLYIGSSRSGGSGDRDLWVASRPSLADPFPAPVNLAGSVNTADLEHLPSLNADETILFFASSRGSTDEDIWMATRADRGATFSGEVRVTQLSTSVYDSCPFVTPDGLTVYLTSTRSGGAGQEDLWVATRASVADPFPTPINLGAVNSASVDEDPAVSFDGRELFFSSRRGGVGSRLWHAVRTCQ